jgi:L-lactate dehydrogenase (cytochrome)
MSILGGSPLLTSLLAPPSHSLIHLNLNEIEVEATKRLSKKGWAYYYSAADDLHSKHLNNFVYRPILLRSRILIDCSRCDTSTTFLGHKLSVPIFVSPAAMARLAHPDARSPHAW